VLTADLRTVCLKIKAEMESREEMISSILQYQAMRGVSTIER
jgi:hypothetical protein